MGRVHGTASAHRCWAASSKVSESKDEEAELAFLDSLRASPFLGVLGESSSKSKGLLVLVFVLVLG